METGYKYCGAFGADILRHLELKVTPPNHFNDPFEFTPKMICSDPLRWAKRALSHEPVLKVLYESRRLEGKFGSFSEFQQVSKEHMPELIKILAEGPQHTLPSAEREFLNDVSKEWGILCMSQRRNSILMWGHYCDKRLGLVIGFDRSFAVFQQAKAMRPVEYVKERVVFDASWELGSPELANYENEVIFSKSDEWSYEAELRQAFMLRQLVRRPLDEKGTLGYFLPIRPEAIVSVTLGPRCCPEQEDYVREILKNPWFRDVKLDRAILDTNNFAVRFEPIAWRSSGEDRISFRW